MEKMAKKAIYFFICSSFSWSKNVSAPKNELNVQLLGRAFDRLETRKSLLQNYQEYCNDEVSYKKFCDMLFDFEENLICDKS